MSLVDPACGNWRSTMSTPPRARSPYGVSCVTPEGPPIRHTI